MKRLTFAAALLPMMATAEEPVSIEEALSKVNGTLITAEGKIERNFIDLGFQAETGREFKVVPAVEYETLMRAEKCMESETPESQCEATITGYLRIERDQFEIVATEIIWKQP